MGEKRHKVLERQLETLEPQLKNLAPELRGALEEFFTKVGKAYEAYEEDRELVEHSLELSSEELFQANKEMRAKNENLHVLKKEADDIALQFQAIFNSAAVGILAVDADHCCQMTNATFQRMMGYSADELKKMKILDITHPEDKKQSLARMEEIEIKSDPITFSKRYIRKDGSIMWARLTATRLQNPSGITGIAVIEDITAQKEAETLIKQQEIQIRNAAIESAHAAGMSEIATGVLHNIGNVLNSVNVGLETLIHKLQNPITANLHKANHLLLSHKGNLDGFIQNDPKGQKLLDFYVQLENAIEKEMADHQAEALEVMKKIQLIKDVVTTQQTYAKGKGEFRESARLVELVDSALVLKIASLKRHGVDIVKKFDIDPLILCQKSKLIHVFLNLIKNAKEAMEGSPNKKVLILEVGRTPQSDVFLKISDTGSGVERENLSKIFSHGFTTKDKGHGFGLHFCANALNEMGGQIKAESAGKNLGTQFTLILGKEQNDERQAV